MLRAQRACPFLNLCLCLSTQKSSALAGHSVTTEWPHVLKQTNKQNEIIKLTKFSLGQ